MTRNNRIVVLIIAFVGCLLCVQGSLHAQNIRIRSSADETTKMIDSMLEELSAKEPQLVARCNPATWTP